MVLKKCWILAALALTLSGCAAKETFETLSDSLAQTAMASPRQTDVRLPDNAVAPVLESDSEQVYLCEDYELVLETVAAGDLNATMQRICGYSWEDLTVMQTQRDGVDRYEFVWVSAGEKGERLGRAVILDDGNYHYCMSVLRDADSTERTQIVWRDVFASFTLV